jgi:hypothetical protein
LSARFHRAVIPALAFAAPLAAYVATASRDLGAIDSGELAVVCRNLGIAHPTGYPLYTLIGRLAALGLPGATPIARLNLLSALCTGIACLFGFLLFRSIIGRMRPRACEVSGDLLAMGAAWLWGVHPALWSQAVSNEVHALQAALLACLLWLATADPGRESFRWRILTAYLLGLAFANHMSTIYIVPALAAGAIAEPLDRAWLRDRRRLLLLAAAFLVPLGLYAYLPLRSLREPLLDWGDPTSGSRFLRHVGGAQYRVWMFTSSASFRANLLGFLREWGTPIGWIPIAAALAGGVALARRNRPTCIRLVLGCLIGMVWASGYDIHDLEPYYATARLSLAGLAVAGAAILLPGSTASLARRSLLLVPLATAVVLGALRWETESRRDDRFVRLYAQTLLEQLPPNAILISRHWDLVVSPILYLQQVEGRRTDVTVVDTELLRRSWYFPQLRRTDPRLLAPVEDRVTPFLEDLRLFEEHRPYDPRKIEEHYRSLISGIFVAHRMDRPIFHTPEIEPTFYGDWVGVPEAQVVHLVPDPRMAPPAAPLDPAPWAAQARFVREPIRRQAWEFPIDLARSRIRFLRMFDRTDEAAYWEGTLRRFEAIRLPTEDDP